MTEALAVEDLQKIDKTLRGDSSEVDIQAKDLNTAAALAGLSIKLLDVMANIYQLHTNMIRLGNNLDMMVTSLNVTHRDHGGLIEELKMRVEDLEAVQVTNIK